MRTHGYTVQFREFIIPLSAHILFVSHKKKLPIMFMEMVRVAIPDFMHAD